MIESVTSKHITRTTRNDLITESSSRKKLQKNIRKRLTKHFKVIKQQSIRESSL